MSGQISHIATPQNEVLTSINSKKYIKPWSCNCAGTCFVCSHTRVSGDLGSTVMCMLVTGSFRNSIWPKCPTASEKVNTLHVGMS